MKVQVLTAVVAVVLTGMATGDTKVVTPYTFPGAVVVGEYPTHAVSYIHHTAAATVPAFRSSAFHYAVPQAVQAVQYAVPQAVQYAAVPAVSYSPGMYSATYQQPAAVTVVRKEDYARPLAYATAYIKHDSLEDDADDVMASLYGMFDEDHFEIEDHDDRK